jgi:hypothetical protein
MLLGFLGQVLAVIWIIVVCKSGSSPIFGLTISNLLGYFHDYFPTNLVLFSPVFLLIGGGGRVVTAAINMVIVDISPPDKRYARSLEHFMLSPNTYHRTRVFYVLGIAVLLEDLIATPLGSLLLEKDLWLPYQVSMPVILLAFPLLLALPETLSLKKVSEAEDHDENTADTHEPSISVC